MPTRGGGRLKIGRYGVCLLYMSWHTLRRPVGVIRLGGVVFLRDDDTFPPRWHMLWEVWTVSVRHRSRNCEVRDTASTPA
jgi:hypothetical protein